MSNRECPLCAGGLVHDGICYECGADVDSLVADDLYYGAPPPTVGLVAALESLREALEDSFSKDHFN